MKRESDTFHDLPHSKDITKCPRIQDQFELRLLIPSRIAGCIIGKGGSNIQKLRNNNSAKVRVPNCDGPERIVSILADNEKSLIDVIQQTLPGMLEEIKKTRTDSNDLANTESNEVRILLHQSIVGAIIGKGGSKIKEIRGKSGAHVKLYGTCAPQSTDRCVRIQGINEKICIAFEAIVEILFATEIKGNIRPYNPSNFDGIYSHEYGGYGYEQNVYNWKMFKGQRGITERGNYAMQEKVNGFSFGNLSRAYRTDVLNFPVGSNHNYPTKPFEDTGTIQTTKVTIPKDMGGAIIGPGGSRIRKIRFDSNADIKISKAEKDSEERIITISGTEQSIQFAQFLLQQCGKQFSNTYAEKEESKTRLS